MSDFIVLDPARYTVEELLAAARGEIRAIKPQVAVALLKAKQGGDAVQDLIDLARDPALDRRARRAATLALGSFPSARDALVSLSASQEPLVSRAANQALKQSR